MINPLLIPRVMFRLLLSSMLAAMLTLASSARAHEVLPTIADMTQDGDRLVFDLRLNLESFLAGIDQENTSDTGEAPQAERYDALHALPPEALEAEFTSFWPQMAANIAIMAGETRLPLTLDAVSAGIVEDPELSRQSTLTFSAELPAGTETVTVGWDRSYGTLVVVQQGVDQPYDGYLEAGAVSPPITLAGGDQAGPWATFFNYIPVGFDHIVPLGLDHILFVLGLFFLSTRFGPLLWQISAFTLAHTITLALAALGYVSIPPSIVEPLIAASIVYVAVENLFTDGLSRWRPFVIFGLGLLHGLGFASVLGQFGLPEQSFIPALIGFNVGVEIGQLCVIAVAFLCVFKAVEYGKSGQASRPLAAVYLVAMVAVMALIIPVAQLPDEEVRETTTTIITGIAGLLGLVAAALVVGRFDSYRQIVAMPASILIAATASYWTISRVFL